MGKTVAAIVGIVAAVAIAIAAPYLAPIALGALGITATATAVAIATAVITIALGLAVSFAFKALGVGAPSAKDAVGPPMVFRQSISNSFIVYGKRRLGGLLAFFHSSVSGSDHYRYFVIACAGHRCQGVVTWMLGDEVVTVSGNAVTSGKYAGAAWLWFQRGLASETANSTFVSECGGRWTTDHKGNGIAAIYAKFKMTDASVQAGMPNITAVVEGRDEILDPRDASTGYSNNGPLVFYDWMKIPREEGGFGAYDDEIPDDDWISAQANVSDEDVDGEARYALDGVIQTGAPPADLRDVMIVNMAGTYAYSNGKHLMRPGYWVPSSGVISEDDFAGPIQVSPMLPGDISATEINGTFIDPANNYQGQPLPTWKRSPEADDVKQVDIDLGFVTSLRRGARILSIMGKRAECEKQVVVPLNVWGIRIRAMDTWQLGTSRYSLSNYAFVISNWGLSADPDAGPGIVINGREENSDIYGEPTVTVPTPPDPIVQPTEPLQTASDIQSTLRQVYFRGLDPLGAVDVGSTATITISGTSPVMDYPGDIADVAVTNLPVAITGLPFLTTFYAYADVDAIGDTTPTFGVTSVYGDSLNSSAHPMRVPLNQQVATPANGGTGTSGGGYGGGYGGGGQIP